MPRELDLDTLQSPPRRNRRQLRALQFLAVAAIVICAGLVFPPISIPAFKMSIDGATPNETRSDIESNSAPKLDVAFRSLATTPSSVSSKPHQTISQAASSRLPNCVETMDDNPKTRLRAVRLLGML